MRARWWIYLLLTAAIAAGCGPEPLPQEKPTPPVEEPETPDNPTDTPEEPPEPEPEPEPDPEPNPEPEPDPAALLAALREGELLPPWQEGCLDIHSINGGRGESFWYIFPDGTTMLVDAAGGSDWEVVGEDGSGIYSLPSTSYSSGSVIVRYIRNFAPAGSDGGVDYAMVSHYHGDHMGNFTNSFTKFGWRPVNRNGEPVTSINLDKGDFLLNGLPEVGFSIPFAKLIDRGEWDDRPSNVWLSAPGRRQNYANFIDWTARTNGTVRESLAVGHTDQIILCHDPAAYPSFEIRGIAAGGNVWTGSGTNVNTSWMPSSEELLAHLEEWDPNENIMSCVFTLRYGAFDWFSGGDIQYNGRSTYSWKDIEKPISKVVKKVEAMKACHHSTSSTNSTALLGALKPDTYVIGVWTDNQPNPDTMKRLYAASPDVRVFATNMADSRRDALLAAGLDPDSFCARSGHIVLRVLPGGASYYVIVLNDSDFSYTVRGIYGPYGCQ